MAISDLDQQRALAALRGQTSFVDDSSSDPTSDIEGTDFGALFGPSAAPPPEPTEDPPPQDANVAAEAGAVTNQAGGALGNYGLREYMRAPMAAGPSAQVVGGYNYPQVGGRGNVERATDDPEFLATEAAMEATDVQDREGKELAQHWQNEQGRASDAAAYVKERRDQDYQAEMQRQGELEQKTQMYSQNLADRKNFWRNPGNIISAIGFALMPFASDDKAIGIKLLNNAIASDFNQRKELADSHLGELKSNLAGYRQITGDRQAGDLLAQAESYRIAAMEVQRIAASYQGPKSQAAAKAMVADLMNKYGITRMEAMNRIYLRPQGMAQPIAKAYEGQAGYQNLLPRQSAGGQQAGRPGTPTGTRPPAVGQVPGLQPWSPGQDLGPGARVADAKDQPVGGPGRDTDFEKRMGAGTTANIESRAPGTAAIGQALKGEVWQQAYRNTGQPPGSKAFNKEVETIMDNAEKGVAEIAKLAAPHSGKYAVYSEIQRDLGAVESAFKGDRAKINGFYGGLKKNLPGTHQAWTQFWNNMGMGTMGENQRAATERAAQRLNNLINKGIGDYYHEHAGANLAPGEVEMLKRVISASSDWNQVRNFVDSESRKNQSEMTNAAMAGPNPLSGRLYLIQRGIDIPKQTSPGR